MKAILIQTPQYAYIHIWYVGNNSQKVAMDLKESGEGCIEEFGERERKREILKL